MTAGESGPNETFRYRVYWEDTDAGGVVYHARYLQFLERARSDWLASLGVSQTELRRDTGLIFAVTRMEIDFRKPARLEDELAVSVRVQAVGRARMDFTQQIRRGDELLIEAAVRAACLDAERFAPARMPEEIQEKLRALTVS
ncbi:MAG: tol-pal system-associated acyl-CoA thioesterase [Xanthomonadales bacterium]|nr:tol-pal system-associated acyl-CoA thioesterase [Xanthomonadales bacterium]|tara:strand:+ start:385 stop:813 length:429 start_codon:yes stop_codon:yes gene_type:complete